MVKIQCNQLFYLVVMEKFMKIIGNPSITHKKYHFQVYYITCPEVTINFAHFKATPTGKEITIIEQATGTCVANAEVVGSTPTYLCKGDGKWTLPTGGCKCKAGFQPDFEKQTCTGKNFFMEMRKLKFINMQIYFAKL